MVRAKSTQFALTPKTKPMGSRVYKLRRINLFETPTTCMLFSFSSLYKRGAVEVKRRFEALEQEIVRLKQALSGVAGESLGEARRAGAVERLQAAREAGNVRER
jgi:hypothetical protein